ncbi:MAG: caspase family protein [Bacteroidales bacterium]|nr:caspase family protein [Bacteroidales bacterium]
MKEKSKDKFIAVIIGLNGYDHPKFKKLFSPVNDALLLTDTLNKAWQTKSKNITTIIYPNEVELNDNKKISKLYQNWGLKDAPYFPYCVTRKGILNEIKKIAGVINPNDIFLFYFSGHGVLINGEPGLVLANENMGFKQPEFLKISDILELFNPDTKNLLMLLDCCQSTLSESDSNIFYNSLAENSSQWDIFLSCSPFEYSLEDIVDNRNHSLFTNALIKGLKGEACQTGDSGIGFYDLVHFVCKRVQNESGILIKEYNQDKARIQEDAENRALQMLIGSGIAKGADLGYIQQENQNPVLYSKAYSPGGFFDTVIAPQIIKSKHNLREKFVPEFFQKWFMYTFGAWPVKLPLKSLFLTGGAVLYGLLFLLTGLWISKQSSFTTNINPQLFTGIIAMLLWILSASFAVAANEIKWHRGGYFPSIMIFVWHVLVFVYFTQIILTITFKPQILMLLIIPDLILILFTAVLFGTNINQSLIAFFELLRKDNRRYIVEAIRIIRQFREKNFNVDMSNLVAMQSISSKMYIRLMGYSIGFIVFYTVFELIVISGYLSTWIILLRNFIWIFFIVWHVVGYMAQYRSFEKEVFKA